MYPRDEFYEHFTEVVLGLPGPLNFINQVFKGYTGSKCSSYQDATKGELVQNAPKSHSALDLTRAALGDYSQYGFTNKGL